MYSKELSDVKYNLAKQIVDIDDVFSGYKQTDTYKNAVKQVEKLQQLTQLQQLEQLQELQRLEVNNKDYRAYSELNGAVIYLAPPYENSTNKYKGGSFDSIAFYDWAFEMAKNNTVLISSYEISDPRFEVVYEFKTARSTLQGGHSGKRYEKLFMVEMA